MGLFWSKNGGTCLDDDNGGNMEHHGTCLGRIPPSVQVPWRKKSRRMWGRRLFQWHLWVYLILFAQTCQGDFQQVRHIHMKSCFTHRLALPTAASLKTSGSDIHIRSIRATRAIQQLRWQFLCLSLAPGLKVCNICLRAIHHFLVTLWRTENVILACGPLGKASIAAGAGISRHCHQWSQSFWFTKFVSFRGWEFAWSFWIRIILENFRKLGVEISCVLRDCIPSTFHLKTPRFDVCFLRLSIFSRNCPTSRKSRKSPKSLSGCIIGIALPRPGCIFIWGLFHHN